MPVVRASLAASLCLAMSRGLVLVFGIALRLCVPLSLLLLPPGGLLVRHLDVALDRLLFGASLCGAGPLVASFYAGTESTARSFLEEGDPTSEGALSLALPAEAASILGAKC